MSVRIAVWMPGGGEDAGGVDYSKRCDEFDGGACI